MSRLSKVKIEEIQALEFIKFLDDCMKYSPELTTAVMKRMIATEERKQKESKAKRKAIVTIFVGEV